jgi:hypothetical protein
LKTVEHFKLFLGFGGVCKADFSTENLRQTRAAFWPSQTMRSCGKSRKIPKMM